MPALERSPEVQEKIDTIAHLPTSNESGRNEKRNEARLLRMETLLNNGVLAEFTIAQLTNDPTLTIAELRRRVQETCLVHNSIVVEDFLLEISGTRSAVFDLYRSMGSQIGSEEAGAQLFNSMSINVSNGREASMPVRVLENYPLAIGFELGATDFNAVDTRTNVGGFFLTPSFFITPKAEVRRVPLIIVRRGEGVERTIAHEQGHSKNNILQNTLGYRPNSAKKTKLVWGVCLVGAASSVVWLKRRKDAITGNISENTTYNTILQYALGCAKDELLAEMNAEDGNVLTHRDYLLKKGGLYDFFKSASLAGHFMYDRLWSDYKENLTFSTKSALEIWSEYSKDPVLKDRIKYFRWALAQIPLEKWNTRMTDTFFTIELQKYKEITQKLDECRQNLTTIIPGFKLTADEKELEEELDTLKSGFYDDIAKNISRPLLPIIESHSPRIEVLYDDTKESRICLANDAYIGFLSDAPDIQSIFDAKVANPNGVFEELLVKYDEMDQQIRDGIRRNPEKALQIINSYRRKLADMLSPFQNPTSS